MQQDKKFSEILEAKLILALRERDFSFTHDRKAEDIRGVIRTLAPLIVDYLELGGSVQRGKNGSWMKARNDLATLAEDRFCTIALLPTAARIKDFLTYPAVMSSLEEVCAQLEPPITADLER